MINHPNRSKSAASPLVAFHGNAELKEFVLAQLDAHRKADRLVHGVYWENGKGCAVGCTLEAVRLRNGNADRNIDHAAHALYESELGIPVILARLEDRIFEGMRRTYSQAWPERFVSAIQPGADLAMVWPHFACWLLTEEIFRYTKNSRSLASLAEVGNLYREWIDGAKPSTDRWRAARKTASADAAASAAASAYAAASAAASAAYAADADAAASAASAASAAYAADADASASAAAASAASAAADAAASAASYAAAASAAYAYAAATATAYDRQADKLVELLQTA
jgi:hypothetical protein